jgi:hypothetical protein
MSATKAVQSATRQLNAVVVSSGLMQKTVKVRIGVQVWNSHLQKVCISSLSPPIICNLASCFSKQWKWKLTMTAPRTAELQPASTPPSTRPELISTHRRHHIDHLWAAEGETRQAHRQEHHRAVRGAHRVAAADPEYRGGRCGDGREEG